MAHAARLHLRRAPRPDPGRGPRSSRSSPARPCPGRPRPRTSCTVIRPSFRSKPHVLYPHRAAGAHRPAVVGADRGPDPRRRRTSSPGVDPDVVDLAVGPVRGPGAARARPGAGPGARARPAAPQMLSRRRSRSGRSRSRSAASRRRTWGGEPQSRCDACIARDAHAVPSTSTVTSRLARCSSRRPGVRQHDVERPGDREAAQHREPAGAGRSRRGCEVTGPGRVVGRT